MKYLIKYKIYENKMIKTGDYYIIHIDGSFEKFEIALEKLGIRDDFFKDWNIINYNDLVYIMQAGDENKEHLSKNVTFLCIYKTIYNETHYLIRNTLKDLKDLFQDIDKKYFYSLKFKGEIFIEDYELNAKKYNI